MKTFFLSIILLILLSSYKTYNVLEYNKQNQLTVVASKKLILEKEMYVNTNVSTSSFSERFIVEIDGTSVSIKNLYKRQGIQLLSKKESSLTYKEPFINTFSINKEKILAQLN